MTRSFPAASLSATGGFDQCLTWGLDATGDLAFCRFQQWTVRPLVSDPWQHVALAVLDRRSREISVVHDSAASDPFPGVAWQREGDWRNFQGTTMAGSFHSLQDGQGRGAIFSPVGSARWQSRDTQTSATQTLQWPLGGMRWITGLTDATFTASRQQVSGVFRQGSVQRWGRLAAPGMALLQCLALGGEPDDHFTAHSLLMTPGWARQEAVAASLGILQWQGQTLRFDRWWPVRDDVRLDRYRWMGTLVGETHRLEVVMDGDNPRVTPWLAMNEMMPTSGRRLLRMTPFAQASLRLFSRAGSQPLMSWRSQPGLLVTRQPADWSDSLVPQAAP